MMDDGVVRGCDRSDSAIGNSLVGLVAADVLGDAEMQATRSRTP
jgi:hypothetical protein